MDSLNLAIGAPQIAIGFLLLALARPLVQRRIRPNMWYGVRIRKAFESEENWYAINRFGGQRFTVWSQAMVASGVLSLFLPLRANDALTMFVGLLPALMVMIPMVEILRYSKTL
jgi:uncharacterized membrane protein